MQDFQSKKYLKRIIQLIDAKIDRNEMMLNGNDTVVITLKTLRNEILCLEINQND